MCQDGDRFEGLDIKGLAALTADTVINNIYNRLTERPAGTDRHHQLHTEGVFCVSYSYFCFLMYRYSFPVSFFYLVVNVRSLLNNVFRSSSFSLVVHCPIFFTVFSNCLRFVLFI